MSNDIENSENIKSCIILCGGKSSRMGQDKGSMIIRDKPMIKHILTTLNHQINEAIIVLNDAKRIEKYRLLLLKTKLKIRDQCQES